MKFLYIFGDAAVGKMTVGQELLKITNLRLFHNHMIVDPVLEIFGKYSEDTIKRLNDVLFEDFAASDHYGLIFTSMWMLNFQSDWDRVAHITGIFEKHNADIYYAELFAPLDIRLQRNVTENRLTHKPSKRAIESSNGYLRNHKFRCISNDGEISFENYIKIDNSNLSADTVAKMIKDKFSL